MIEADDYGTFHLQAQWQGLRGLSASLQKRGSGLVERFGEVIDELGALFQKYPFQCIRSYQETGNDITFRRDPENYRPRINKKNSQMDVQQKASGDFFFMDDD